MPYGLDPGSDQQRDVPLEQQRANLGEYLNAVADDAWQSNPLPSLYRWHQRLAADYGQLGAPARVLNAIVPGGGALFEQGLRALGATDQQFQPRTPWLSKEEAQFKGQELGLKLDRAMSQESFDSIAAARRRQMANEAVYERARLGEGYGPGRAALSVLLEFAVNAADPLNAATAFVPVGRLPGIVGRLEAISKVGAQRLARGALEGAAGAALAEPLVALAATDENPNYGFTSALTSVAFGTALGAGLHWLGGRLVDYFARGRETPPAPPRPAPRDILGQEPVAESVQARTGTLPGEAALKPAERAQGAAPEAARADVPQTTAAHIEALHPETRGAVLETILRQGANDLAFDPPPILAADRNWRPIRAATAEPIAVPAKLGERWDVQALSDRAVEVTARLDLGQMQAAAARVEIQRLTQALDLAERQAASELPPAARPGDIQKVSAEEFHAAAREIGRPRAPGEAVPGDLRRPGAAAGGAERGAAGAGGEPRAPEAAGALPRAGESPQATQGLARAEASLRLDQPFDPAQFEAWIKRQADWRADAHADAAASTRADAVIADRSKITPEQDLAELKAATDPLFGSDPAFREELKAALAPIEDEKKALDAFAACRMGGTRGQ